ncbi:phosphate regulon transcriptional regulator PhoB [Candidatus Endowatersipora endosymbiont of Watersipora subatra]|uniref:phosphate regulon transcriptional regulator PhoB n=1 Tax=Candidatus Endowatersipora endosymbiont of Watersipora subatra TaxID=3077946 RepID=UPI00312C89ED
MSDRATILIVEDEAAQLELLCYNLKNERYHVITAEDGEEGILRAREECPDVIVMDWMLPSVSGIEACRQLKSSPDTIRIPIIILTARGEEEDRVRGLEIGADDYVVKPYSVNELIARIRARLRVNRPAATGKTLAFEDIILDSEQHRASRNNKALKLGPTEYRLLTVFMERPKRVWSRDMLLNRVWGQDTDVDLRTVDVHVGRLRKNLNSGGACNLIRTVRGTGYSLDRDA